MKKSFFLFIIIFFSIESFAQFHFFGRNKVHYEKFDWKIIETEHFNIYYYTPLDEIAEMGASIAENAYKKYSLELEHIVTRKIPLIFYNTHLHFQQTNTTPGFIPEGVGGFFEFLKGRVVIPYSGSLEQFEHVIKHELVHVFMTNKIYRILVDHRLPSDALPPLWFVEGFAEFLSTKWDSQAEMVLRDAVINNNFFGIDEIYKIYGTFLMYKMGQAFLEFVNAEYGHDVVLKMLDNFWMFTDFKKVIEFTIGESISEIDKKWYSYERKRIFPLIDMYDQISDKSKTLTTFGFSFSPAIYFGSKDTILFFAANMDGYSSIYQMKYNSEKKEFSDYKKVIQGEREADFEAFHLLNSSLAVSKDGVLAFVTKMGSTDAIHFYDIEKKEIINTFNDFNIVSISSPSFSKRDNKLVFNAVDKKGYSDIFLYDLDNNSLKRLTNDYYDDIDPIFSADESEIIFSSSRTAGENEKYYNLFSINLITYEISYITNLPYHTKTPLLSLDNSKLIFTSEIDGVNNYWYLNLNDGSYGDSVYRFSNFITGGYKGDFLNDSTLIFPGFEKFSFKLYQYENNFQSSHEKLIMNFDNLIGKWNAGHLSANSKRKNIEYEKEYSLDYAQSQITTDPVFGTQGGAVFSISDLLGDDNFYFLIYNTAEVQSDFVKSFNVAMTRIHLSERTNYGYGIFHFRGRRYDLRDVDEFYFERSFGGYFTLSYPLSTFSRFEANLAVINSDKQVITNVIERKALLISNSLSYVFDNSLWANSGPVDGSRFRFLLGYTSDVKYSNVNYYSLMLDMRHYIRLGLRSAVALRGSLFYNDGKEARRYFMGGSWDLRGWPRWSIRGEKMWLTSLEVRFPFIDQIKVQFPFLDMSFVGFRGAVFFDAGGAWDKIYKETLGSLGFGFRFNLFNVIVLRYDLGKKIEHDFTKFQKKLFYQFFFGWDF